MSKVVIFLFLKYLLCLTILSANFVVHAEDLLHAIPGRTIVHCLKTMARGASSMHTLQSYQSGCHLLIGVPLSALGTTISRLGFGADNWQIYSMLFELFPPS